MRRFLLGMALAAVTGWGAQAQLAKPVSLLVPVASDPRTLSPDFTADPGSYVPASSIYSALVVLDWGVLTGTAAYGDLARSWEFTADGRTVTFHLYDGVKWHDGVPVTSDDVVFTFQRVIDKNYLFAASDPR